MNKEEIINKQIELHTIATFQGEEYELENLLNGLLNKLEEKDKEIERLNNIIDEFNKWCDDCIVSHQIARANGDYTISDTFFEIVKNKLNELRNK